MPDSYMYVPWKRRSDGKVIDLITPAHFERLPDGTKLYSIIGKDVVKGIDYIDQDDLSGMLGFGLPGASEDLHAYRAPYREA